MAKEGYPINKMITDLEGNVLGIRNSSYVYDGTNWVPKPEVTQRVAKSTDPKPEGREGHTLFLWDTKQAYIHDGKEWRDI